jgi:hypothetical protein
MQFLTQHLQQQRGTVVLERPLHQPGDQPLEILGSRLAEAQVSLGLTVMVCPCLRPIPVGRKLAWRNAQLTGDVRKGLPGRGRHVLWAETQVAQRADLQGEAQTVVIAPAPDNFGQVLLGEREVGAEILGGNIDREAAQPVALGC